MGMAAEKLLDKVIDKVTDFMDSPMPMVLSIAGLVVADIIMDNSNGDAQTPVRMEGQVDEYEAITARQRQRVQQVESELQSIRARAAAIEADADACLNEAEKIIDLLLQAERWVLFRPGMDKELEEYRQQIQEVREARQDTGRLANAQRIFDLLSELKRRYLEFERCWLDAYSEWTSLRQLIDRELQAGGQATVQLATTQGMEDVSFDAHFWSHDRLRAAAQELPDAELPPDTPMEDILQLVQEARDILRTLQEICQEAGNSFADSQQRLQFCLGTRKALLQRGWRQRRDEDCDFEHQDERETLNLCIYSPANDEMRIAFNPDHTIGLRMRFNGVHNRGLLQEIARALVSVLDQQGVTVDSVDYAN